jgi:hypothetical protein
MNARHRLVLFVAALSLSGCVVYDPVPYGSQPTLQQRFDRSWAATTGAMADEGLTITSQNRSAGVVQGERGGIRITAALETLPDGSVQVKFTTQGTGNDPALIQRVSKSYDRRMGR